MDLAGRTWTLSTALSFRKRSRNQDGDPWLFEIYKRWGCSRILEDVFLENSVGGQGPPRYGREPALNWKDRELQEGVGVLEKYLQQKCGPAKGGRSGSINDVVESFLNVLRNEGRVTLEK